MTVTTEWDRVVEAGMVPRALARWPESDADVAPKPLPGFIVSAFSPLVAEVAERCLSRWYGSAPTAGQRTAVVVVSADGDVTTAARVAELVDSGARVGPLLFFQSVPNAVAGYVATRWDLRGPIVCTSPVGEPLGEALGVCALLFADGDADEALVVLADEAGACGADSAVAVLVSRGAS